MIIKVFPGPVVQVTVNPTVRWARSVFPHPLLTVDLDGDGKLIAVTAVGSLAVEWQRAIQLLECDSSTIHTAD